MPLNKNVSSIQGSREFIKNEAYEVGKEAGLKYIKLAAIGVAATIGAPFHVSGYQGAKLGPGPNGTIRKQLTEHPYTHEACQGQVVTFSPEGRRNKKYGYVIDTPFNRKVLASSYYGNGAYVIDDPEIDKEIKKVADKKYPKMKTEVTKADLKLTVMSKDEEIAKLKAELEKSNQTVERTVQDKDMTKYRNTAKEMVYNENAQLIEKLKEKYGKTFQFSQDYKEKITPLIASRTNDLIKKLTAKA